MPEAEPLRVPAPKIDDETEGPPDCAVTAAASLPRRACRFTVMLPVIRPPAMLPFAIRSVLRQTEDDFELIVIGDGAPHATIEAAQTFADNDPRVCVFDFPKGARNGEAHRAAVLRGSAAAFIAQLGDDDLWFPDHLERVGTLLKQYDFVTTPQTKIGTNGNLFAATMFGDLQSRRTRDTMRTTRKNFFGPSEARYRLETYRSLPVGWSPAPKGMYSDLFMWRKFLSHDGVRFNSDYTPTTLKLSARDWDKKPIGDRAQIISTWFDRLGDPVERHALRRKAARVVASQATGRQLLRLCTYRPITGARLIAGRVVHAVANRLPPRG